MKLKIWELVQISTIKDEQNNVTHYVYVTNNKDYEDRVVVTKEGKKDFEQLVIKGKITVYDWDCLVLLTS